MHDKRGDDVPNMHACRRLWCKEYSSAIISWQLLVAMTRLRSSLDLHHSSKACAAHSMLKASWVMQISLSTFTMYTACNYNNTDSV